MFSLRGSKFFLHLYTLLLCIPLPLFTMHQQSCEPLNDFEYALASCNHTEFKYLITQGNARARISVVDALLNRTLRQKPQKNISEQEYIFFKHVLEQQQDPSKILLCHELESPNASIEQLIMLFISKGVVCCCAIKPKVSYTNLIKQQQLSQEIYELFQRPTQKDFKNALLKKNPHEVHAFVTLAEHIGLSTANIYALYFLFTEYEKMTSNKRLYTKDVVLERVMKTALENHAYKRFDTIASFAITIHLLETLQSQVFCDVAFEFS